MLCNTNATCLCDTSTITYQVPLSLHILFLPSRTMSHYPSIFSPYHHVLCPTIPPYSLLNITYYVPPSLHILSLPSRTMSHHPSTFSPYHHVLCPTIPPYSLPTITYYVPPSLHILSLTSRTMSHDPSILSSKARPPGNGTWLQWILLIKSISSCVWVAERVKSAYEHNTGYGQHAGTPESPLQTLVHTPGMSNCVFERHIGTGRCRHCVKSWIAYGVPTAYVRCRRGYCVVHRIPKD